MLDITELSKEELIERYHLLNKEFNEYKSNQKYGIVWEETKEELDTKNVIPLIKPVKELNVGNVNEGKLNYLIEGDNYHALKVLQHTHKNKVDVVYIDPPYNTGNEFVYNDKIVDKEDNFRHSKWLSFMDKRLRLAKNLMKDDGVIFVSIDDNEQAQLKLLMDEIFGERNFVSNFIWLFSRNKVKDGKLQFISSNLGQFKNTREHILVYVKDIQKLKLGRMVDKGDKYIESRITNKGNKKSRLLLKKGIKCEIDNLTITNNYIGGETERIKIVEGDYEVRNGILQNDIIIEGEFRNPKVIKELMEGKEVIDNRGQKFIEVFLTKTGVPYTRKIKNGELFPNVMSGYGSSSSEYIKLSNIMQSNVFNYPKPVTLIKDILKLGGLLDNKNAIVLDFFAGSGTTGHALMELNKEDGGKRSFILCTNNEVSEEKVRQYFVDKGLLDKNNKTSFNKFKLENPEIVEEFYQSEEYKQLGIARSVTRERIKRVSEGYKTPKGLDVEGLGGNLEYFVTEEFSEEEVYGFKRNDLAELALNSHSIKYPTYKYQNILVGTFDSLDEIEIDNTKTTTFLINARDNETLSKRMDEITKKFGNSTIVHSIDDYYDEF